MCTMSHIGVPSFIPKHQNQFFRIPWPLNLQPINRLFEYLKPIVLRSGANSRSVWETEPWNLGYKSPTPKSQLHFYFFLTVRRGEMEIQVE